MAAFFAFLHHLAAFTLVGALAIGPGCSFSQSSQSSSDSSKSSSDSSGSSRSSSGSSSPEQQQSARRYERDVADYTEAYVVSGGIYAYGGYPDLDGLFQEQAGEIDRTKREAILHKMQQLVYERAMFAPIWELAFLNGVGPRVEESGLGLIPGYAYSAPYEDLKLKGK